ncbi:MAG: hypothetical protein R6V62_02810 [Candidatus Fermentibacteraceae bacterium]
MLLCTDPETIVLLSLVAMLLFTYLLVRSRLPGRPVAFVDVKPDSDWRLGFMAGPGRKYRLFVRFDVAFQGGEDEYGLVVDYSCTAGGSVVTRERAGTGSIVPPERDRFIGSLQMSSFTSTPGGCRHRATIALTAVGPFEESTEVIAGGTVVMAQGAVLSNCRAFFA